MKRATAVIIMLLILVCIFSACILTDSPALVSLGGYQKREYYESEGFQDFTAYAKYYYENVDFSDNHVYSKVTSADIAEINNILNDFDQWVDMYKENDHSKDLVNNYDFDRSVIDTEDYLYIESDTFNYEDGTTGYYKYNLYFYDVETNILYYFHNNI